MRKVLNLEIQVLRAGKSDNIAELAILDFAEAAKGNPHLPLVKTLQVSAGFAAADGLSERDWIQQLRSRHVGEQGTLEALWRALDDLVVNGALPWSDRC